MPPKPPDIAHFDTGRTSRLILPNGICPVWFKSELEVIFLPLHWRDELFVSTTRKLEAFLICRSDVDLSTPEWPAFGNDLLSDAQTEEKPEEARESLFIYRSRLTYFKQQWKLNCPPIIKALCDESKRVMVTEHSLGIGVWSKEAFNEHYS